MWPNAKIGVMGSEQLSAVMQSVGRVVDPQLRDRIERESDATFSSARLWDDGVIPPASTRERLSLGLRTAAAAAAGIEGGERVRTVNKTEFGVFRM
jgi:3-methylcrotonyl-CoA carboxylase beta subunit